MNFSSGIDDIVVRCTLQDRLHLTVRCFLNIRFYTRTNVIRATRIKLVKKIKNKLTTVWGRDAKKSIYISIYIYIYLSIYLSTIYQSIYLSIYLCIILYIYIYIYIYVKHIHIYIYKFIYNKNKNILRLNTFKK